MTKGVKGQSLTISHFKGERGELIIKKVTYFILSALLATLTFGIGTNMAIAEDLAKVMPKDVKVIVDNDRVRVLDVLHKPGVKEPMHSHPAYVSVYLSATKVKVTTPDGKTVEKDRKAGEFNLVNRLLTLWRT